MFAAVIRYVGEHGGGIPGDDFADAEYTASTLPNASKAFLELSSAERVPVPGRPGRAAAPAPRGDAAAAGPHPVRAARAADRDCPRTFRWRCTCRPSGSGRPRRAGTGWPRAATRLPARSLPPARSAAAYAAAVADDRPGESLDTLPGGRDLLVSALRTLELHMRGAALVEFEIRDAELSLLAARKVERPAPRTAIRLALDLAEAGVIDDVDRRRLDPDVRPRDAPASPAAADGTRDGVRPWPARRRPARPSGASR